MRWPSLKVKDKVAHKIRISPLIGMGCFLVLASAMIYSFIKHDTTSTNSPRQINATAAHMQDSMPSLHSVGVSTLISDSGVIRYHLVAEEWDIYTPTNQAATWKFVKGLLMLRLDTELNVDLYVQADTAYLHQQKLWELRGRVRIRNIEGTKFNTEELFWDLNKHEMWNHAYMTIITPERTLEGTEFQSNENMTRYSVMNSKGDFPMSDADGEQQDVQSDTTLTSTVSERHPDTTDATRQHIHDTSGSTIMEPAPTKYDFQKEEK